MKNYYTNLNQLRQSNDGQTTVKRQSRLMLRQGWFRNLAMIFAVLVMSVANVGTAWGANGDVLFNQGFGSATAVAYSANTERSYSTSSTLSGLVGTGDNLFQGAQCNAKTNCGIAINTTSGANSYSTAGTFQAYANYTSWKWALYKTTNFATTAPTAIKFEMDYIGKFIASSKQEIAVVVGSGFSVGTSAPAANKGYTGFNIISGSSSSAKHCIGKVGGNTKLETTGYISNGTSAHITWIINATGSDLTYTGPDSKSYTLATAKYDLWVGTTRVLTAQDRATTGSSDYTGTTMQNLYIGNAVSGKHEVIIDNVKVTDLTPSCDAADLTASNITSNGNQEAGTGITFSKVGSPASGDTWYWQTSATGTDKTYNATSPYTTATTAGSYTVYLRAFNTDCWGTAASMTNTIYPAPSAMIHNTFAVNDAWSSTIATQDKTNITSLNAMAAVGETVGSGSNKSGLTQKIPSQSSEDASKYMSLSFNVASGKQLNVTSVVFDEQPVTGTGTFKVSISDNQGSATKTQTIASGAAGSKHTLTLDGDIVGSFKGTVTVKVWAYGWGDGYRFGDYFYINGTVTDAAACTAPNHVDVSGNWDYFCGETINLTATAYSSAGTGSPIAAGNITGYQWQKLVGTTWTNVTGANVSGATTANLQITNCTKDNSGKYRCVVSTGATCSTASATKTDGTEGYGVKVFVLAQYAPSATNHNFTRVGSTDAGTVEINLTANQTYEFEVVGDDQYYGNIGTISGDVTNWVMTSGAGHLKLTSGSAGGTITVTMDYSTGGNNATRGIPELSVVYPKKRIYMRPSTGEGWAKDNPKFFIHSWGLSDYDALMTEMGSCDAGVYYADIYASNTSCLFTRQNPSDGSINTGSPWNKSNDITIGSNDYFYNSGWNAAFTGGTYSTPTYTISYNAGTGGSGSKASESKTCGVAFTLPNSAVFTRTGYTQTGWTTSDGGAQTHALGGSYTDNAAQTFYPVWTVNNYDLTWNLAGGTTTSAGTGIASDVSSNTTTSQAFGTALTAPTVTKTGYNFSAWSPAVAATMPAENTTYTATWTAVKVSSISVAPSSKTLEVGGTQQLTATVSPDNALDQTVTWSTSNSSVATVSSTGLVTAVAAGTCTITATAHDGSGKTGTCAITVTAAASQTALVINTLYEVPDMIPSGATLTDGDQFFEGLSANTKFELIGSASSSTTPKANSKSTNDKTIDGITFDDGSMWFRGNASLTSNIPTTFGLSFIVPEGGGKLYLYFSGTSTNIKLAKSGASGSKPSCASGYGEVDVTAGTYYLYGTGETSPYCFYGLKLCSKYNVSISTTNVTKTDGATGTGAAINGKAYTATFTALAGYTLPSDVKVSIGGTPATKGTEYTWSVSDDTGTLTVKAANVTGNIVVTVAGAAAATYALTYNCNGAESGCPSNTTASALPNPLPSAPTKDGYTFDGWYTDEGLTVAAVAGATMTEATTLYAKWTVNSSSECITITHWGTSNATTEAWAGSIADENKYKLAQSGSGTSNNKSTDSNASICLYYGTTMSIYDSPTTTTDFANVTSVSFKVKLYNASKKPTITVSVGSDSGETVTLSENTDNSTFKTYTVNFGKQLTGAVKFKNNGSGDSGYKVYLDEIEICTASMASCTTPVLPTLNNQSLCEGADIAAWDATVTNASAISAAGETVTYSWKKKGNATELANEESFDLGASAAESQAGTYVVTVTVSKTGKASATATKEVTLSVTEGIEVTGITADKATVYPTNSVTLTATASADATWQWYTCSNAEGASESRIDDATSASYTIASAGSAGTYYYKVKATGSCGMDEMVYTLTVSAAAGGDCFHYVSVLPDKDISPSSGASIVTPTHATTLEGGTMKVGSQQITITKNGLKLENSKSVSITLDAALEAGNVVIVKGTSAAAGNGVTINGVNFYESGSKTFDVSYTVAAGDGLVGKTALTVTKYNGSSYLQEIKITGCGTACTDPEVTASVNNSTACVGSSVTFTATGAHASATYQWQKYSGGAWTDIASATAATYNIASVATTDALKYRVIASHACDRTSNEVTLSVPVAPVFGSFTATRSVMATQALSITDVEASDATSYAWYKSADATYDAGTDTKVGTTQELLLASGGEAAGATYYLFCVASNACGSTTSSAITVSVTALVEEDCSTRGNESDAEFGFQNSGCSQGTYNGTAVWSTGTSNSKILIYSAPDGKYFKTMKVTIASSSASKASYNWSTDGGSSYTADGVAITGVTTTLTEKTINLSAHGNVNEVKIGRNFGNGESSGTLYVSKICFEYTSACTATTVTPSTSSKTHTIGESFTKPTFTLGPAAVSSGTLTYSSSDEEIASVDESGNVTFNGTAGTVTITASYAGATIADVDYCASEGSYTITVSCEGGAPMIVAASSVNMSGCNSSVTLNAKTQAGADFAGGSYQWFHNGVEIEGATAKSYTAMQTGVYTVAYTSAGGCTSLSTNNATVTSATVEPEVTKLVPFQYYHVDKTYTAQMKDRHLFSVKGSAAYGSTGKNFKLTMSRNGGAEKDITTEASIWVERSDDGQVDNVMIDLNKLSGKYSEGDELVLTCAAVDCSGKVSTVYKDEITIHVIGATPTLALICSGTNKSAGTRKTSELTVGGDFLTGYNKADLCQQTGNTSFDANTEWGLYTELKAHYIVTPVNGYAVFNKLNYEPFDILLLTDYPKASKSDAAADVLDDMAALCDYRPMLSFKAHMVAKSPSKWAAKGFTTSPVVPKNTRTRLNIVCYAHPMFEDMKTTATHIQKDNDDPSQIVYTMLTGAGYESSKGLQGFELEAAENFVVIGLTHYNATPADGLPSAGLVTWTPGTEDRMLVTAVERQENLEARMIMFAVNCGAQSKFTETGRNVVLKCLEYLLDDNPLHVADCSFTFDNGAGNSRDAAKQAEDCPSCTGTKGDGKWSTAANWGPDYVVRPGKDTEVKIAAPVTVDPAVGAGAATSFTPKVRSVRILEGGQVEIPAGSYLEVVSTIRRQNGNDIYPTEENDIHIGTGPGGNGTLIFNNTSGDTKAHVGMYSKGFIDYTSNPKGDKNYQYMGVPCVDINAAYNYYGSWIYSWSDKGGGSYGWKKVVNGGIVTTWTGYCITQESAGTYYDISGTLAATGTVDIDVPAGQNMVVGNSWTAPIDISKFATTDFENLEANVYFFNTGIDKEGAGTVSENATGETRWTAGTYVTVPVLSAEYTGEDDHIPSLQGFFVKNTGGSAGTLHLDYDKHVRGSSRAGRLSGPLHAPVRRAVASTNEPAVLKIKVSGENYDDKLLLLEREDFTEGFDNGWDGDKWDGNESALYIYTTDNNGTENSVSAIPELEGTVIGFRAGEDDAYTLNFEYLNSDEPLYLYDVENNTYTQIMTGMTYRFFTTDNEKHARFIITRTNGQEVATGVEPVSGSLDRSKAKKLLIEDKMFIMVNGMLYDATGKVVK